MEGILEILFELFGELFAYLLFHLLALIGSHAIEPYRRSRPRSAAGSIISHLLIGGAIGGLSLLIWRESMVHGELARVAYLVLGPVAAGGLSALIGLLLKKWGKDTIPLERFGYAYLFAFSLSAVRFLATR